ncbi:50S ribosomal protein L17 [Patescibacteria group bacterium]|nr:50S ribosomal protein L17 [Patescibacteria group bacterium]
MRHRKKGKILGRKKAQRVALFRTQAKSFFQHGKITTTEAKAKQLKSFLEKLITTGKKDNLASLRRLISSLNSTVIAKKIIKEVSPKYIDRKGGYLRVIKLNRRKGDGAKVAKIEYVESDQKNDEKTDNKV